MRTNEPGAAALGVSWRRSLATVGVRRRQSKAMADAARLDVD
jgi:hypothetical protein